jgi:hypothetical protein
MPDIDVSFVLADPMFASTFDVIRRAEAVGSNGRTAMTPTTIPGVVGVVLPKDPADVVRSEEAAYVDHAIEVHAEFVFKDTTQGFQPDQIIWRGRTYTLHSLSPFSHYGAGYQRVVAVTQKPTDPPQF